MLPLYHCLEDLRILILYIMVKFPNWWIIADPALNKDGVLLLWSRIISTEAIFRQGEFLMTGRAVKGIVK